VCVCICVCMYVCVCVCVFVCACILCVYLLLKCVGVCACVVSQLSQVVRARPSNRKFVGCIPQYGRCCFLLSVPSCINEDLVLTREAAYPVLTSMWVSGNY